MSKKKSEEKLTQPKTQGMKPYQKNVKRNEEKLINYLDRARGVTTK